MDRLGDKAERDPRQGSDQLPAADAPGNLTDVLTAFESRLDHLEQFTTGIDQRLLAIEARLHVAAPMPSTPIAPPVIAGVKPSVLPPAAATAPLAEPTPVSGDPEARPAPTPDLLDREWVSRRSDRRAESSPPPLPAPAPTPSVRAQRRPAVSIDDLERAVSGRGLAWAGGLTLLLGALFFLGLAISRGWIGPETRVAIALVAGIVVTVLGDRLMRGGDRVLGPVLVAVGIGIWNLGLIAGTRLYDFVPLWTALLGAAAGAAVATAIAVRANAQIIALYGIVTALAAPILFDVPEARTPISYLVVVLVGSTAISIARGWPWLPPVAFALSAWQFYQWWFQADPSAQMLILAISTLSILHLVAAVAIELRARTIVPQVTAGTLLGLNAISFAVVGVGTLDDNRTALAGFLLAGVGAHAAAGWFALERSRRATGFVYDAFGIAVILLTIAVPVYFRGSLVAIAWAAEAVGLVWLAGRSRIVAGYPAAVIVFALAVWQYFSEVYGATRLTTSARLDQGVPFVNGEGLALLALLALLAMAGVIVREQWARVTIAVVGFGLLIATLPAQLAGLPLLAGWSLLAVLTFVAERLLVLAPGTVAVGRYRVGWAEHGLKLAAVVAAVLAIDRAIAYEMPVLIAAPLEAGVPYGGQPLAATVIIILAALAALRVTASSVVRQVAGSVAILIAAHLAAFELALALAVAAWAGLAVAAAAFQRRTSGTVRIHLVTALLLLATGVAVTLRDIASPSRLLLTGGAAIDHPFLWSEATLALGALALAFAAVGWSVRGMAASVWLQLAGGVLALYLLSIGIVDEFQGRVSGAASVAELRRQSQVALSVVWAVLGGLAVAVGLVRALAALRWFGLGLLTLATAKVFLYDLASLDAVYRVLSFMVLGILLLLSSYAYRRLGARPVADGMADDVGPFPPHDREVGDERPRAEPAATTPGAHPPR